MSPSILNTERRTRVVIVGSGFAGLEAAKSLAPAQDIDITIIDRTNHHLFQPLLYQVATAGLTAPSISAPVRHILREQIERGQLTVLQGIVTDIDARGRQIILDRYEHIAYDYLILASGSTHSYFGHDEWSAFAPGLKTLADAFDIRRRIYSAFEHAERESHPQDRAPWLNFVVVGAGPTGVEMAGTLVEIAHRTLSHEYRRIDSRSARILLIEGAPRVLGAFPEDLSARAQEQLERLGVEVLTGAKVTDIHPTGIQYECVENGANVSHFLPTRTVIWAAGVAASPLGKALSNSTGCALDRAGRVIVQADLSVDQPPEIFVVGDLANAKSYHRDYEPRPVPGVSPAAKQMGRLAAANILRARAQKPTRRFRYQDYGSLATIGRRAAVSLVEAPIVGTVKFSGFFAWLFWLFVHIYFLIGFRNRIIVFFDWAWAYFTSQRHSRAIAEPREP